jgi:hypothetical protein
MNLKKLKQNGFPRKWIPRNPDKYEGSVDLIVVRSSWEVMFLNWCDSNPGILRYSSEEIVIPYYSPVDNKHHRYFPDAKIITKDKTFIVEIKPMIQTEPPKKRSKNYLLEASTFMVNKAKWKAADEYCRARNWSFKIITEYDLGLKHKGN